MQDLVRAGIRKPSRCDGNTSTRLAHRWIRSTSAHADERTSVTADGRAWRSTGGSDACNLVGKASSPAWASGRR